MPTNETWNLDPPPGFQGLREDLALTAYTRHMPHWRQAGATYFVTFRLSDSLPQARLQILKQLKCDWESQHADNQNKEALELLARMVFERIERWLDQGSGDCVLRNPSCCEIVHQAMQHFHGQRYELGASVVMPNHVHCIVRPFPHLQVKLEDLLGGWKSYTSRRIQTALGKNGPLWQEESYDRIIRDEEHLWRCLQYIGVNPRKANLNDGPIRLWLNPEWADLGWQFIKNDA
jgi:REP element-mobilizing transposase RayT